MDFRKIQKELLEKKVLVAKKTGIAKNTTWKRFDISKYGVPADEFWFKVLHPEKELVCEFCGKNLDFGSLYTTEKGGVFCSKEEAYRKALEKRKKTCLKRYNSESVFQNEDIKKRIVSNTDYKAIGKKISETAKSKSRKEIEKSNQKRKDTISRIPNFYEDRQKKIEKTCLERYNVKSFLETQEAKDALKDKYGADNISQTQYWHDKVRKSSIEKFGVKWPTKNKDVIAKTQKTNLDRYGYKYWVNNPEFRYQLYKKWTSESLKSYNLDLIDCELIGGTTLKCKKCGYEKEVQHAQIEARISFCPNCYNEYRSKYELLISEHLKDLGIEFTHNDRSVLNPKELDILVPKYSLAIEVDGLYWHQNKPKDYHLSKTDSCLKKKIRLIHLTDRLLIEKPELVMSVIDSALGISQKIYARKCAVKQISSEEYKEFCEKNHIQGYVPAKVKLGLFYNDELIQVESFSKPRFSKKYEWELIRECSKIGLSVVGGKSKLFKHFLRNYSPKSVVSYCDRSMFTGSSYIKALGMELVGTTSPSYSYYKNGRLLSRYQCQKHKLKSLLSNFDSSLSERENMQKNGYGTIYDCGENVYLWQLKSNQ